MGKRTYVCSRKEEQVNIVIVFFSDKDKYGMGHYYRSLELVDELERNGNYVTILGNNQHRRRVYFQIRDGNHDDFYHAIFQIRPDIIIFDVPSIADYYYEIANDYNAITTDINAGSTINSHTDINIVQGYADVNTPYKGEKYVILRKVLGEMKDVPSHDKWLVYNGSSDMPLIQTFNEAIDQEAFLLTSNPEYQTEKHAVIITTDDTAALPFIASSGKACVAFGMIVWELIYFHTSVYAFSLTEKHLEFATEMDKRGLIKAYPEVGVPKADDLRAFLEIPFTPTETSLDLEGAARIARLLEDEYEKRIKDE